MGGDDYVIDENGAWGNQSAALEWYRSELARLKSGQDLDYKELLSKYIDLVALREGVDFIASAQRSSINFSEREIEALKALSCC